MQLARRLQTGGVFVNGFSASDPRVPIGGVKKSGFGRELSHFGIREFVNAQTVCEKDGIPMSKGSDLLVAALENEGVERIFGIPGEENLDVVESLRHSSIELVVTRHEQAAVFMAATYARLTGKPGVCLATLGPGALNFTTGAAYALLGAWPVIMITGQKGIVASKQARFQIVDIVSTMKPLTKQARQIVSARTIPTIVREAFRVAQEERPGPVLLELPEDIAANEVEGVALIPPHAVDRPIASPEALDRAAEIIRNAKRPLLMIASAASRPQSSEALWARVRLPVARACTWAPRR
ncbi:hypothetical protein G6F57_017149 [Rhizopus arrhizus]|nr:hypothetical protein G6F57_017149 [Rhizopus arrhizus]